MVSPVSDRDHKMGSNAPQLKSAPSVSPISIVAQPLSPGSRALLTKKLAAQLTYSLKTLGCADRATPPFQELHNRRNGPCNGPNDTPDCAVHVKLNPNDLLDQRGSNGLFRYAYLRSNDHRAR